MTTDDPTRPEFWDSRYESSRKPWDLGEVPDSLNQYIGSNTGKGSVLIPGCGTGYEVRAFHEAGYNVTALDFSPAAVNEAQKYLGSLGNKVIIGDFFTHKFRMASFDIIYERTFLCSFPPRLWIDYVNRVASLLKPNGKLVGIFVYGHEEEPPPYCLTSSDSLNLFGKFFDLEEDKEIKNSLPLFQGMERWQIWTKRMEPNL